VVRRGRGLGGFGRRGGCGRVVVVNESERFVFEDKKWLGRDVGDDEFWNLHLPFGGCMQWELGGPCRVLSRISLVGFGD
jgi:hypothetical protein